MQKQILATAFVALACTIPLRASAAAMYDTMYIFGDSLSDNGNYFEATGGQAPPSYAFPDGLYTNGPIWGDHLASMLGATEINFAIAGATTSDLNVRSAVAGKTLPGLQTQVNNFTAANPAAEPDDLYIVFAGVNDLYYQGITDVNVPVANITRAVTKLADAGAKDIMVFDSFPLDKTPGAALGQSVQSPEVLDAVVNQFNSTLAETLNDLSQSLGPSVNIIPFNAYSAVNNQFLNPAEYGYTNVTSSCVGNPLEPTAIPRDCLINPDNYLWYDDVHPTTKGYSIVAQAAFSTLQAEPVPEPSAGLGTLALGALGAALLLKRKQKQASPVKSSVGEVH